MIVMTTPMLMGIPADDSYPPDYPLEELCDGLPVAHRGHVFQWRDNGVGYWHLFCTVCHTPDREDRWLCLMGTGVAGGPLTEEHFDVVLQMIAWHCDMGQPPGNMYTQPRFEVPSDIRREHAEVMNDLGAAL